MTEGGGGEADMRGGGSIPRWQQGAPRGPLKAAGRITSSSFSDSLEAPVEGVIVSSLRVCRQHSEEILGSIIFRYKEPLRSVFPGQPVNVFYIWRGA